MKKYFVRLIPCIIILILVVAARYMYYISSLNTFVIPSSIAEYVVGDTPASFVENKGHDTFFEGNFAYSKVDKDNNLILKLTDSQLDNLKLKLISEISNAKQKYHISKNYDKITVRTYRETAVDDMVMSLGMVYSCAMYQLLNEIEPQSIKVEWYLIDAGNGTVLDSLFWPGNSSDVGKNIDVQTITSKYQ